MEEKENEVKIEMFNEIILGPITIRSNMAPLGELEFWINRLIKKHKKFLLMQQENKIKTGGTYLG